jgi:transcriptional regulator with XRE-family HTH domain
MEKLSELIGNRLKEIRKEKGLRQEDMDGLGLSYKYYQRIEAGKVNLTLNTLEKIAKALSIDVTDLFILPLSTSKEINKLTAQINKIIKTKDNKAIRKLNLFIGDIL